MSACGDAHCRINNDFAVDVTAAAAASSHHRHHLLLLPPLRLCATWCVSLHFERLWVGQRSSAAELRPIDGQLLLLVVMSAAVTWAAEWCGRPHPEWMEVDKVRRCDDFASRVLAWFCVLLADCLLVICLTEALAIVTAVVTAAAALTSGVTSHNRIEPNATSRLQVPHWTAAADSSLRIEWIYCCARLKTKETKTIDDRTKLVELLDAHACACVYKTTSVNKPMRCSRRLRRNRLLAIVYGRSSKIKQKHRHD